MTTTDTEYALCHDCRARLEAAGYPLATGTTIPWPRPDNPKTNAAAP